MTPTNATRSNGKDFRDEPSEPRRGCWPGSWHLQRGRDENRAPVSPQQQETPQLPPLEQQQQALSGSFAWIAARIEHSQLECPHTGHASASIIPQQTSFCQIASDVIFRPCDYPRSYSNFTRDCQGASFFAEPLAYLHYQGFLFLRLGDRAELTEVHGPAMKTDDGTRAATGQSDGGNEQRNVKDSHSPPVRRYGRFLVVSVATSRLLSGA